jgi:DNA polymerase I-like protein with 3'-5' exonuclease and polymerase domains
VNTSVVHVTNAEQYAAMLRDIQASRVVAVDYETSGLDPLTCVPLLLAVKGERGPAYVVETDATGVGFLSGNLGLPSKVLLAHNAVFEYMFFRTGVYLPEDVPQRWFCTQVAEALIQSGLRSNDEGEDKRVSLSEVYAKYCGITADKTLQTSFVGVCPETFDPTEAQVAYAAQDVLYLHEVMEAQLRRLEAEQLLRVARLEMAVIPPLGEMQLNGFYLNLDRHLAVLTEYEAQEAAQRAKVEATLAALYKQRKERENQERANVYAHLDAEIQAVAALEKLVSVNAKMLEMEAAGKEHLKAHTELWERAVKYNAIVAHATQLLGRVPQPLSKEAVTGLRKVRDANKPLSAAFNLGSHMQVWEALAEAGIELYVNDWDEEEAAYVQRRSLDKNAVKHVAEQADANPVLVEYASWAKAQKVLSTYGHTLRAKVHARTGRVHAEFNQLVSSGRFSSNRPNLQNMPPKVRACFEAEGGLVLISADGKNQEGRIAAALSEDPNLLDIFRNDWDWHSMTAVLAYPEKFADWHEVPKDGPERKGCKNANFSGIYGGTPATLVARGYVPDLATAERLFAAKEKLTPKLKAWTEANAQKAVDLGYAMTASGRKRYFNLGPKPRYGDKKAYARWQHRKGGIRRAAMNHPIQGTGADIMKQAMVYLRKPLEALGFKLVCMVHDSLVYEGPRPYAGEAKAVIEGGFLRAARQFIANLDIPGEAEEMVQWH